MSRLEDQANYYKNIPLRDRSIIAVVHLENKNDERFWSAQLQNVKSGKYLLIPYSRNEAGVLSAGCEQCLKFRDYCSSQFFICVDSDLRLLRGEKNFTPEQFIAQTHSYSWENHSCQANHLQRQLSENLPDCPFCFETFLNELSLIVYRPLLHLVHYQTPERNSTWNISGFNRCIPLQPNRKDLEDNGREYLQRVKDSFQKELEKLNLPENYSVDGLTPENAYLHMQGHHLYKLVCHIGRLIGREARLNFRRDILEKEFPLAGYEEIDNVQSDLRTILNVPS